MVTRGRYVEAPLLYRGRKFDVRIFVLLEARPRDATSSSAPAGGTAGGSEGLGFSLYAHREGYGRTSSEIFSLKTHHTSMHLTNWCACHALLTFPW